VQVHVEVLSGFALCDLGLALARCGEPGRGRELLQQALAVRRATGSATTVGLSLNALGQLALEEGDLARADAQFRESITNARLGADRAVVAASLEGMACAAADCGAARDAARLHAASVALRNTGTRAAPRQRRLLAAACRTWSAALSAADQRVAEDEGAALAAAQAWDALVGPTG
jgi:Tetratricopeptide repeat